MPVYPGDSVLGSVNPKLLAKSWDRAGIFSGYPQLGIAVYDAIVIDFYIDYLTTDIPWLDIGGFSDTGYLDPTEGNGNFFVPVNKLDTSALPNGVHKAVATFGFVPNSGNTYFENVEIFLTLSGVESGQMQPDKASYSVVFNREDNTLSGETAVGILNNTSGELLKFWQNSNIFAAASGFTDTFNLAEDPGNPLATNPLLPATGNVNIPAKILKMDDTFVAGFTINLTVVDGGISVQPSSLAFEVFKFAPEQTQTLNVVNPLNLPFTVEDIPEWLSVSPLSGSGNAAVAVQTIAAPLAPGDYNAVLKFVAGSKTVSVPVYLQVKSFVLVDTTKDFCLDLPPVVVKKKNDDAFFVRFVVRALYKVMEQEFATERVFSVPYFQNEVHFELGEKIQRYFPRWTDDFFDLAQEITFIEKIKVNVTVEELKADRTVLFTQDIDELLLFPGKKPAGFPLLSNGKHRKKNNQSELFQAVAAGALITLEKVNSEQVGAELDLNGTIIKYYNLPGTFRPVHLQWENLNYCPEWFTLTGDYRISPEFNHIYARNIFNAQNEKYDVSAVRTLFVNTGYMLAAERDLLTEIIESKSGFVKVEGKVYKCFNITKKHTEMDSTEELIARDLEFLIVEKWK